MGPPAFPVTVDFGTGEVAATPYQPRGEAFGESPTPPSPRLRCR